MGRCVNVGSPGAHEVVAVHEESIIGDGADGLCHLVRITGIPGLTWLKRVGEIDNLHMTTIEDDGVASMR